MAALPASRSVSLAAISSFCSIERGEGKRVLPLGVFPTADRDGPCHRVYRVNQSEPLEGKIVKLPGLKESKFIFIAGKMEHPRGL